MISDSAAFQVSTALLEDPQYPKVKVTACEPEPSSKLPNIVFCQLQNPLYGLYIVVPTAIVDNRGLPHTLEHLIFTGSRLYPERGYLDKLATVCLSTGTNAYTSEDHTCYFVSTASFEGLLNLLPVYLDHILYPALEPEDMALEVFSLDPGSKEARGVVYCEMKSREHTEADQMDIRLRNLAFKELSKSDPDLETYRWECGGATERVSHLTPEEIRAYHGRFYRPEKLTVFVSGNLSELDEERVKEAILKFAYEDQVSVDSLCIEEPQSELALGSHSTFPADDESIGSVAFSWLGPPASDIRTTLALNILLRSLRETTASPLFQEFVECAEPCASDIDYDVRNSRVSLLSLIFSGVPTGNEDGLSEDEDSVDGEVSEGEEVVVESKLTTGVIRDRMFALFQRLMDDDEKLAQIVTNTLRSFTMKLREQYQEDPHELAFGYCLPEILGKGKVGSTISEIPSLLASLSAEPISFWKGLFTKYLINGTVHEVIMVPSKAKAAEIKAAEKENLELVLKLDKYPKNGAALLEKFSGTELPHVELPEINLDAQRVISVRPGLALHLVKLPSSAFNTLTLGLNLKHAIDSPKLRRYLVLFQELLLQCDLKIPEGVKQRLFTNQTVPYQDLQRKLASMFTNHEAGVGLGNELFSCSYLDSHLIMSVTCPSETTSIPQAIELLLLVLRLSQFTKERISVTLDNLVSQLSDSRRDPSTVIEAVFTQQADKLGFKLREESEPKRSKSVPHISSAINIFVQDEFLNGLKRSGITDEDVQCLQSIADAILTSLGSRDCSGLGSFIHIGVGLNEGNNWDDEAHLHQVIHVLGELTSFKLDVDNVKELPAFPSPETLPRYAYLTKHSARSTFVVPMADVTASYLASSLFLPLLPTSEDLAQGHSEESIRFYLCMALMCNMLSFTEGPLYNRVRGKGLAYGAYLSLSLWNGLLSFDLNDSTAPVEAFQTFIQLIKEVIQECDVISNGLSGDILCSETLYAAKASFAFNNVSDRSTPSNIFSLSLRSALRGGYPSIDSAEHAHLMEILKALTLEDLASECKPVLQRFLEPSQIFSICVVPPSSLESVAADLSKLGNEATVLSLDNH